MVSMGLQVSLTNDGDSMLEACVYRRQTAPPGVTRTRSHRSPDICPDEVDICCNYRLHELIYKPL